jgi:hypothetical protein
LWLCTRSVLGTSFWNADVAHRLPLFSVDIAMQI